jgi:ABC-type branched-subunit amino acid transport system ATPase component
LAASAIISVEGVSAAYGKVPVLHDVSLSVGENEIVAIIGPNGAGKSTALKTTMGYLPPTAGRIFFLGEDVTGASPHRIVRKGMGYVPQGRVTFPRMTVLENLEMGAFMLRDQNRVREGFEMIFSLFPVLAERKDQLAGNLSGGEQQMVAIARAMVARPRCIVLDEPSLGLSPKFVDIVFKKLVEMRGLGVALLLVEQNAARALAISDRGYVFELGRNRAEGTGADLLASPEIKMIFIGG